MPHNKIQLLGHWREATAEKARGGVKLPEGWEDQGAQLTHF